MRTKILAVCLGALLVLAHSASGAENSLNYQWTQAQMNPRMKSSGGRLFKKISAVRLLPENQAFPEQFDCHEENCRFDLFYFTGQGFNLNQAKRKTILFIAGGPGQVVSNQAPEQRMLGYLEARHNLVYFDVRGAGRSVIEGDNRYDFFLRAQYVVDDIEKIRKAILKNKPWDAIYTHSWGSLPGQLYAARFGPAKLKSLVLSAPVVRSHDTGAARTAMTAENLANIYAFYRSTGQTCSCQDKKLPVEITTISGTRTNLVHDLRRSLEPPETSNFCFMSSDEGGRLAGKLAGMIDGIEERYGSVDFVTDHYEDLQKVSDPTARPRFPKEFYVAIKQLQFSGAPVTELAPYTADFLAQRNAAIVIGHYLTLDERAPVGVTLPQKSCSQEAPFFAASQCRSKFCAVVETAKKNSAQTTGGAESLRAHDVFGFYDGVSRALLRPDMVRLNNDGCFTGKDLAEFAKSSEGNPLVRAQAQRIGANQTTPACLWTPKKHPHTVRTLILKGSRDTVIAGCQAEDFYRDGLKGERALIEFRGMGHAMYIPMERSGFDKDMALLIEKFSDLPTVQFVKDPGVLGSVKRLQGEFREPSASRAGCPE
jgi:pimeloyl-ACP methyl ester carboxylesterase